MPPEDSEQPGNTEKADFLDDLARTMVTARQALSDSGGKITMRRLNRREYRNTIEHLTGVKVDVGSLPSDGGSGTFDTVGSSQSVSEKSAGAGARTGTCRRCRGRRAARPLRCRVLCRQLARLLCLEPVQHLCPCQEPLRPRCSHRLQLG